MLQGTDANNNAAFRSGSLRPSFIGDVAQLHAAERLEDSGAETTRTLLDLFVHQHELLNFYLESWCSAVSFKNWRVMRSQSYHWLELNHPEGAASPYKTLLKQDCCDFSDSRLMSEDMIECQEKMYKTTEPFEASFQISGIQVMPLSSHHPSHLLFSSPGSKGISFAFFYELLRLNGCDLVHFAAERPNTRRLTRSS